MRIPATVLAALGAVVPVAVSTLVLVVVAGALPALAAWALIGSLIVVTAGLFRGIGEGVACRLLVGGRTPTELERSVLGPAVVLVCRAGLGPPLVKVRVDRRGSGLLASPFGHRTVLVPGALVEGLQTGAVNAAAAAAAIIHAAAVTRARVTSPEPALTVWCLPWLVLAKCAEALGRAVLLRLAWRGRLVVVTIAVAQLLTAHHVGMGLGVATLAGLTYLLPAAERSRVRHVIAVGDNGVASRGLGREYLELLERSGARVGLERRARLTGDSQGRTSDARVLDLAHSR